MKINDIKNLIETYGGDTTLNEVMRRVAGNRIHKCPKCCGKGFEVVEYNGYPSGLPDSGWVYEAKYKNVTCDLCKGEGYTEKEYKPKMVQMGWE